MAIGLFSRTLAQESGFVIGHRILQPHQPERGEFVGKSNGIRGCVMHVAIHADLHVEAYHVSRGAQAFHDAALSALRTIERFQMSPVRSAVT